VVPWDDELIVILTSSYSLAHVPDLSNSRWSGVFSFRNLASLSRQLSDCGFHERCASVRTTPPALAGLSR
jgi:hypothetical protein